MRIIISTIQTSSRQAVPLYNILSVAKRFSDYETIGELFRGTKDDAMEVAIAQRILEFIIGIAAELEEVCGCDTDRLIDSLINRPDGKAPFVKMYEKLIASFRVNIFYFRNLS